MLGFFGIRANLGNLCNLQTLDPSLGFYVRWTETSSQPEILAALAHKTERHLAQLALYGVSVVPRAYAIANHPNVKGSALYTFTPSITGTSLMHLHDSLSASTQTALAFNKLGAQLGKYRSWAHGTGEIMYDIAGPSQYLAQKPTNRHEPIVPQLVDVGTEFASFSNIKEQSYISCFAAQQYWLEHAGTLEDEQFANTLYGIMMGRT